MSPGREGKGLRAEGWKSRTPWAETALSPRPFALLIALLAAFLGTARLVAHDIPNEVSIHAFIKPEGQRLRLVVRVPLVAMRDMDYPKKGSLNSGLLDLSKAERTLRDAATLWVADDIEMYEEDTRLAYPAVAQVRAALPADRSFESYDAAIAHLTGAPLPDDSEFLWTQGMLDILFEYTIQSDRSRFSIRPKLERLGLRTNTSLRFLAPDGSIRAFDFANNPGLVRLDPRWTQAIAEFISRGFSHALDSLDPLLFLFCVVIPFRRFNEVAAIAASFAVGYAITLIASAYGYAPDQLWFPSLIGTLMAIATFYMALENLVGPKLERRWPLTFGAGLIQGFGFSLGLRQVLQFAGTHALTAVFSFTVGIALGLLLLLILVIPALGVAFKLIVTERLGAIILSALAAHAAWHWMIDRGDLLRQYRFEWPALDLVFWIAAMRWAMLGVIAAGLYWIIFGVLRPRAKNLELKT